MTSIVGYQKITPEILDRLKIAEKAGVFRLRELDERECLICGMTGSEAIEYSVSRSSIAYAVVINNRIVACWGYSLPSVTSDQIDLWMLTTPAIEKHKFYLGRASKRIVKNLLSNFTTLRAYVAAEYLASIHWLEWLGFTTEFYGEINGHRVITMKCESAERKKRWAH